MTPHPLSDALLVTMRRSAMKEALTSSTSRGSVRALLVREAEATTANASDAHPRSARVWHTFVADSVPRSRAIDGTHANRRGADAFRDHRSARDGYPTGATRRSRMERARRHLQAREHVPRRVPRLPGKSLTRWAQSAVKRPSS